MEKRFIKPLKKKEKTSIFLESSFDNSISEGKNPAKLLNRYPTQSKNIYKGEKDDSKLNSLIQEFNEKQFTSDVYDRWLQNYFDNPLKFFSDKNLKKLKGIDIGQRLSLFAQASSHLTVTPDLAHKYYSIFPEDLQVVAKMFELSQGLPKSGFENYLFSISIEEITQIKPDLKDRFGFYFQRYKEIAERKKYAPKIILNNFEHKLGQNFKKFGKGAEGFLRALDEAAKLIIKGSYFINPNMIFTKEYYAMPEKQKALFLREAIAELQYHLIFEEVYNSCFNQEIVNSHRQQLKENAKHHYFKTAYNFAHSMIYKTYQPVSVYEYNSDYFQYVISSTSKKGGAIEEYPYHRLLLAVLNAMQDIKEEGAENVKLLVDFWNKNRNPIFGEAVAKALSSQDINLAAAKLMELIYNESSDGKRAISAILYRLEFGQIGISEEGVKYLEKIYDLGEYNNPDYYVSRLTPDGEVGVFNEERELIKYFHLGDLSNPEKKIRAKVLDFVYETLFVGKEDENPEEKQQRLKYLEEFKRHHYHIAQDKIFKQTGVRLNNLSFQEQGWFVIYFNQADQEAKERLRDFVGQYGEEGIKTFLALDGGMQNGQAILNIGEKINPQVAEQVFRKFNSLTSLFKEVNQSLIQRFFKSKHYQQLDFTAEILARVQRILLAYEQKINQLKYQQLDYQQQIEVDNELLKSLDEIKEEVFLFAAMFKEYYQHVDQADFQELKGVDYARLRADQLNNDDIQTMKKIYAENYQAYPEEFRQKLLASFDQSLTNPQAYYDLLRYQGKVVAFLRFDYLGEEAGKLKKHFAAFNVDKNFTRAKLGEAMLKQALKREKTNSVIVAGCDPQAAITKKYLELGFKKVKGFVLAGVPSWQIELRD